MAVVTSTQRNVAFSAAIATHAQARADELAHDHARVRAALPGVSRVWPSAANYLLVDFADAGAALARTRAVGLLLRDLRRTPTLGQSLRISVGTPRQNDRLLESLS